MTHQPLQPGWKRSGLNLLREIVDRGNSRRYGSRRSRCGPALVDSLDQFRVLKLAAAHAQPPGHSAGGPNHPPECGLENGSVQTTLGQLLLQSCRAAHHLRVQWHSDGEQVLLRNLGEKLRGVTQADLHHELEPTDDMVAVVHLLDLLPGPL